MPRQYDLYLSFSNDWILSLHLLLLIPTLYEPYYILNYRRHHSCKFHMSFIACRFSDSKPWRIRPSSLSSLPVTILDISLLSSRTGQCYSILAFWTNLITFFSYSVIPELNGTPTMKLEKKTKFWLGRETIVWVCIPIKICD